MSAKKEKKAESKQPEPPKDENAAWLTSLTVAVAVFAAVYAVTMSYNLPVTIFGKHQVPDAPRRFVETLGFNKTTPRVNCDESSWSVKNMKMSQVQVVEWDPEIPFAQQLVSWREPVILKNTFVTKWKALERWHNDDYLKRQPHMKIMNDTMIGTECMFSGFAPAALEKMGVKRRETFKFVNMSSDDFFGGWTNPTDPLYYFWYGRVEGALRDDVNPTSMLWIDPSDEIAFGLYMWLSGVGIGPWLHFDQDHNFYVQVSGTKRFILIPPWEYKKLYMYPRVHPHWHKSQVNFDNPDFEKFPEFKDIEAYVADLVPGDVLHVPAYWWHHVRSQSRSVSLASWSQSGVYRKMRFGLYERDMLFDRIKDPIQKRAAFIKFIQTVASRTLGSQEAASKFFKDLFAQRWAPLAELFKDVKITSSEVCPPAGTSVPSSEKLEPDVRFAVESLETCQTKWDMPDQGIGINRPDMQAIRDMELGDYIEFVAAEMLPAEQISHFVEHCLSLSA